MTIPTIRVNLQQLGEAVDFWKATAKVNHWHVRGMTVWVDTAGGVADSVGLAEGDGTLHIVPAQYYDRQEGFTDE